MTTTVEVSGKAIKIKSSLFSQGNENATITDIPTVMEEGTEDGGVEPLEGIFALKAGALAGHQSRQAGGRIVIMAIPGAESAGLFLIGPVSSLGAVLGGAVPLADNQREAFPGDGDTVAILLPDSLQPDRCNTAPGSEVIRVDDDSYRIHHLNILPG